MAKCIVCGKKGLFFKVNAAGRCAACQLAYEDEMRRFEQQRAKEAVEKEEREQKVSNEKYNAIVEGYKRITAEFDASEDDEENLVLIPVMEEIITFCNEYKAMLDESLKDRRLRKMILKRETSERKYSSFISCTNIDTGVSYYPNNNADHAKEFIEKLKSAADTAKVGWKRTIKLVEGSARLAASQKSTPAYEIERIKIDLPKLSVGNLHFGTTNVTQRSNYEKLGNFCVIDTETTGLNAGNDKIVEICAVRYRSWEPVTKYTTLINPGKHIPITASDINGITDDMVTDAPTISEIAQGFLDFIGKDNLVGHNIGFDLKFIYKAGIDFTQQKRRYYDTLELIKKILAKDEDVPNYKLDTLCNYYYLRLPGSGHRAESDCFATAEVFKKIVSQIT